MIIIGTINDIVENVNCQPKFYSSKPELKAWNHYNYHYNYVVLGLISISVFFANKKKSIATQAPRHTSIADSKLHSKIPS